MIAVIPARSGSKGLPGKNIKSLKGKPLIAYTIEAALNSKLITDVILSTDSYEIEKIAIKFGAKSPFLRPAHLASDKALSIDNYIHLIGELNKTKEEKIENFVVLQPTSPLRTAEDIDSAINLFNEKKADSVISYTQEKHPISWHKYVNQENKFQDIFNDDAKNRQDYRPSYYPNGAIYIFKTKLINSKKYYSENSYAYIMNHLNSVDIDTIEDFEYVEFLLCKK
ncbi:MAG: CMP-N,N'-diacetyllegionaminic acid synthase [Sphingobacteriales bacterium]|jgi:CMP-N,N'-diacetyllegionaminic acid synthase